MTEEKADMCFQPDTELTKHLDFNILSLWYFVLIHPWPPVHLPLLSLLSSSLISTSRQFKFLPTAQSWWAIPLFIFWFSSFKLKKIPTLQYWSAHTHFSFYCHSPLSILIFLLKKTPFFSSQLCHILLCFKFVISFYFSLLYCSDLKIISKSWLMLLSDIFSVNHGFGPLQ